MSGALIVEQAGPAVTLQDLGRPGHLAAGLSPGGAMDCAALYEGAALLGVTVGSASIEMGGIGGRFRLTMPGRVALTGAQMRASVNGASVRWNAVHRLPANSVLEIGGCLTGQYGYLSVGGGIATHPTMGSRSVHTRAGIGAPLQSGDSLPLGSDPVPDRFGLAMPDSDRFSQQTLRVLPSAQTSRYPDDQLADFEATTFHRAPRGSRLGVALSAAEASFALPEALSLLSEVTVAGDVQITGDGTPFVLLADCQTTGGYPRIACILPMDLPCVAQAAPGAELRFRFVTPEEGLTLHRQWRRDLALLGQRCGPFRRDPGDMADLLTTQLVSGVTDGSDQGE